MMHGTERKCAGITEKTNSKGWQFFHLVVTAKRTSLRKCKNSMKRPTQTSFSEQTRIDASKHTSTHAALLHSPACISRAIRSGSARFAYRQPPVGGEVLVVVSPSAVLASASVSPRSSLHFFAIFVWRFVTCKTPTNKQPIPIHLSKYKRMPCQVFGNQLPECHIFQS
eukprot:4978730-Amphidinium_carterae.1